MNTLFSLSALLVLQGPQSPAQDVKSVEGPVTQQHVLKAMQSEVTAIVRRVRGAVVTIQDVRMTSEAQPFLGGFGANATPPVQILGAPSDAFGLKSRLPAFEGKDVAPGGVTSGIAPSNPLQDGERWDMDAAGNRVIIGREGQVRAVYETPNNPDAMQYRLNQVEQALRGKPTPESR